MPQKLLTGARTEGLRAVRLEARTSRAGRRQYRRSPYIEVWRSVPATVIPRELRHSSSLRRIQAVISSSSADVSSTSTALAFYWLLGPFDSAQREEARRMVEVMATWAPSSSALTLLLAVVLSLTTSLRLPLGHRRPLRHHHRRVPQTRQTARPPRASLDTDSQQQIWKTCAQLVGVASTTDPGRARK